MTNEIYPSTSAESADAVMSYQRYRGGSEQVLTTFGDMAAVMEETEVLLCGSSPAFRHFAAQVRGLSWRVLPSEPSHAAQACGDSLVAICVHSVQYSVELVFDPASASVRQCYAAWQRRGYVTILVQAGSSAPKLLHLGVQSLNEVLPLWPMSVGWPTDADLRMLDVVERFEVCASSANTIQVSVIELSDECESADTHCTPSSGCVTKTHATAEVT